MSELSHEKRHQLSRVVKKAAKKGRRGLFERLTKENEDTIQRELEEEPVFYTQEVEAPTHIDIDASLAEELPEAFFENPTLWIERQPMMERKGEAVADAKGANLWEQPYDRTKVRKICVGDRPSRCFVSKRLNESTRAEQEDGMATWQQAIEKGIPTPKIFGTVEHHGNRYVFSEYIDGKNIFGLPSACRNAKGLMFLIPHRTADEKKIKSFLRQYPEIEQPYREHMFYRRIYDICIEIAHVMMKYFESVYNDHGSVSKFYQTLDRQHEQNATAMYKKMREMMSVSDVDASAKAIVEFYHHLLSMFDAEIDVQNEDGEEHVSVTFGGKLPAECTRTRDNFDTRKEQLYIYLDNLFARELGDFKAKFDTFLRENIEQPIAKQKQQIIDTCRQEGVAHKDFDDRNFVISWNREIDLPDMGADPLVYVVDWI